MKIKNKTEISTRPIVVRSETEVAAAPITPVKLEQLENLALRTALADLAAAKSDESGKNSQALRNATVIDDIAFGKITNAPPALVVLLNRARATAAKIVEDPIHVSPQLDASMSESSDLGHAIRLHVALSINQALSGGVEVPNLFVQLRSNPEGGTILDELVDLMDHLRGTEREMMNGYEASTDKSVVFGPKDVGSILPLLYFFRSHRDQIDKVLTREPAAVDVAKAQIERFEQPPKAENGDELPSDIWRYANRRGLFGFKGVDNAMGNRFSYEFENGAIGMLGDRMIYLEENGFRLQLPDVGGG